MRCVFMPSGPFRAAFWILTVGVLVAAVCWFGAAESPELDSAGSEPGASGAGQDIRHAEAVGGEIPDESAAREAAVARAAHEWRDLLEVEKDQHSKNHERADPPHSSEDGPAQFHERSMVGRNS